MDAIRIAPNARARVRQFLRTPPARQATQRIVTWLTTHPRGPATAGELELWWTHTYGVPFEQHGVGRLDNFLLKLHIAGLLRATHALSEESSGAPNWE